MYFLKRIGTILRMHFFCNRICIADVPILLKLSPEKVVLEMACLTYARKPICINICKEFLTTAVFFFSCAFQYCNAILSFFGCPTNLMHASFRKRNFHTWKIRSCSRICMEKNYACLVQSSYITLVQGIFKFGLY